MLSPLFFLLAALVAHALEQQCDKATEAGWDPVGPPPLRCDIAVRDAANFSVAEFLSEFHGRKPVLIRGAAALWPAQSRWTRPFLSDAMRDVKVLPKVPPSGIADPVGLDVALKPLTGEDFYFRVGGLGGYFFRRFMRNGTLLRDGVPDLGEQAFSVPTEDIDMTKYFEHWLSEKDHGQFLAIGGEGAGLNFHQHEAFWGGLISGRKHWLLAAEEVDWGWRGMGRMRSSGLSGMQLPELQRWLRSGGPHRDRVSQCYQEKGDVLYGPGMMPHCTLNIGSTVSISHVWRQT